MIPMVCNGNEQREKENELRNGNETEPQLLFVYPIENKTAIEGGVMFSTNFTQPKHGAVVHLTKKEAKKLAKQWGLDYNKLAK